MLFSEIFAHTGELGGPAGQTMAGLP